MMNIENIQAYPKLHFGPRKANGTLEVNLKMTTRTKSVLDIFYLQFAIIYQVQMEKHNKKV